MNTHKYFLLTAFLFISLTPIFSGCNEKGTSENTQRARSTLDAIFKHYGIADSRLLRETFPFNESYAATYLAGDDNAGQTNPYSYLWPFSGSLSAVSALYESTRDKSFKLMFDKKVLPGLEMYLDKKRSPDAYASYIHTAPLSDRFYDDNIWIGIDFTDMYLLTGEARYLDKAKEIWKFIESGTDTLLGGGIYWCEQKKFGKNTCSNAPGAVYALKLFEATRDSVYFHQGKTLYHWTKKNLQDPGDYLYYDNIKLNGRIDKTKYAYNSGQMMQAAALLHKLTKEKHYLTDAQNIAASAHKYFFQPFNDENGCSFRLLKKGNVWFTAIMFRGFIELYHQDKNKTYLYDFKKNLNHAWKYMRDENGLFSTDWSGHIRDDSKWLLTQFAMVEMYARMSKIE